MLAYLVERGMHRVRALRLAAGALEVRLVYVETRANVEGAHDASRPGSAFAKRRAFPQPTDATDDAWLAAQRLLDALPRRRALVKRIGIVLHDLKPAAGWQGRLFDDGDAPNEHASSAQGSHADRQRRLDAAIDQLRAKLGFGRVLRGPSAPLAETHPLRPDGYRLRTPSLNQ
jgi:pyruvate/2-oxoglutarate dehydrogenase complex dihydrolipoamide acyltransferase (E2) component